MEGNVALIQINKAQAALEQASDIHEILDLRDKAQAVQMFAAAQGAKELAQEAKIFQLKAERKAGDWLAENVTQGGHNSKLHDVSLLPDGIEPIESHRWQLEAKVPTETFNNWVDECLSTGKEISAAGLQRLARFEVGAKVVPTALAGKYRVIYADPPWKYGDQMGVEGYKISAEMHYPTMSLDELCDLPVPNLTEDSAVLFLWVTVPMMQEALKLIDAWGFEYKTHFIWDKVKHNWGHYSSVRHELLMLCTRGSCLPDITKLYDSVISIERTEHSRKPEQFRELIDTLYPNGQRIELFAREKVAGWETWGNEPNIR